MNDLSRPDVHAMVIAQSAQLVGVAIGGAAVAGDPNHQIKPEEQISY